MPVLRGAVTLSRFRAEPVKEAPSDIKRWLTKGLKAHAFEPIDRRSEDDRAAGFVELENADASEFPASRLFYGEYALFAFRIDTLKVPASLLKAELGKWVSAFEKQNDRQPSRAEKAQGKGQIRHELRQRQVPRTAVLDVSWNQKSGEVQIWAASRKTVDEITVALETALGLKLAGLSPAEHARREGLEEKSLGPTAELIGMELQAVASEEVSHVEA